jgi:multiple sugar transport system permease protein
MSAKALHPDRHFKYWLVAPAIFLLLLIGLFPLIYSLIVSFMRIDMMDTDTSFAGLYNYQNLFKDSRLWWSLAHTMLITVIALPLEPILGLAMAYLFLEKMPGRPIFISLLVLPTIISPIVAGATWRLLFDNRYGPINQIVSWVWGERVDALWTISPTLVYAAIIFCEIWQWTPFIFLILLAALSNVDKSQTEAAEIDGASFLRAFRYIVLPAIWPVMAIAILIRGIDLFRIFDINWTLTKGGPGAMTKTISIYAYVQGFKQFETSYTAAIAFPLFLLYVWLGWVDSYVGLILLYTAFSLPYVIWMMRGYIEDIPLELEESALVDGCIRGEVLWKVVLPMARTGLFATAVFTFIFAWNDFLFALVLTRTEVTTYTVQVTHYFGGQSNLWAKIAAMSVLGTIPVFFTVAVMQRYLVRGISMGAVKG